MAEAAREAIMGSFYRECDNTPYVGMTPIP